ncbi:carboxy terminal-processing peptidase [Prosthecobacter sp.]|uniref:carboxy terminal-processing peptidase n=1 Tax=Prosthecobacter sp. TaxID=1965333 RepID=UPI003784FFF1
MRHLVSLTGLSLASLLASATPVHAETDFGQVAMHLAYMLQNHHLSNHPFDDEISQRLLENYLTFLDPSHLFFTRQDVDAFRAKYATSLDDSILVRSITPALEIFEVAKQRLAERLAFIKKHLEAGRFTFDSDRTLELQRSRLPWPADKAAADQLWLNRIEGELLTERLADRAAQAPADPPEKRLLARYERMSAEMNGNDKEDITGMFFSCLAQAYDSTNEYFTKRDSKAWLTHSQVGIGVQLTMRDDAAEVTGIVTGGPADKGGRLKLKDKVLAVAQGTDGAWVDARSRKLREVIEMMRGKPDTVVRLRVSRTDAAGPELIQELSIIRQTVALNEKLARAELIEFPREAGGATRLGWLHLSSFYADMESGTVSATADVSRLLKRLIKENIKGLVLDLRGNGGGSLDEAIKLPGLFIPAGPVIQTKDSKGAISSRACEHPSPLYDGPMIVLTDRYTASAAEILAAALQDYRRAIIVGDKNTFGRGVVQTILPVERYMPFFADKTAAGDLKVTILKFYRITGDSTQLRGVIPDLRLPSTRDVMELGESALPNPLPYDTIPALPFKPWSQTPLPTGRLGGMLEARLATNPDFQAILEDSRRLRERLKKNTVSLNEKQRLQEIEENSQRIAARSQKTSSPACLIFPLTLENVDNAGKLAESDTNSAQNITPEKLETLRILSDWIPLSSQ